MLEKIRTFIRENVLDFRDIYLVTCVDLITEHVYRCEELLTKVKIKNKEVSPMSQTHIHPSNPMYTFLEACECICTKNNHPHFYCVYENVIYLGVYNGTSYKLFTII